MKTNLGIILLSISMCIIGYFLEYKSNPQEIIEIQKDSLDLSLLELNKDNFIFVCHYYEIDYPEIVYAQAQLESGRFTSKVYKDNNNFLGLYNSKTKSYYHFNHWTHCLKGYKDFVQSKWDGNGDYYEFLLKLPYATDPNYLSKIKRIVNDGRN